MSDPSGIHGVLALEAVEWAPGDGDKLTIRVRGRWRRRRPDWRGQPTLVIEAEGQRHRFPAVPEPPSLAGAPPGGWEMTFSIPAWLAPHLGGRMWLGLGLVMVPLPAPVGTGAAIEVEEREPQPSPDEGDLDALVERRVRTAELAARRARAQQAEAEAALSDMELRLRTLEEELDRAMREPRRLRDLLAQRDRQRREAEQRAHAEEALRLELQEALDSGDLPTARRPLIEAGELAQAEERVRQLESQLAALRRRVREAEARAPSRVAPPPPMLDLESELAAAAARYPASEIHRSDQGAVCDVERRALDGERRLIVARASAPAAAPGREPASGQLATVLAEIRAELDELTALAEREHLTRLAAERRVAELETAINERELRSTRVSQAVDELRGLLEQARSERGMAGRARPATERPMAGGVHQVAEPPMASGVHPATEPPPAAGSAIEAERFDAALSRLRAATPPEPGSPETPSPVKPWLKDAFARLVARDPDAAGRLLVGLLPAQGVVHPAPIAYDLVLSDELTIQLTVGEPAATPTIAVTDGPRELTEVAFRVVGDHAALARLVNAGAARRILRRGRARVAGDRGAVGAIIGLVRSPLRLEELHRAGVRLDPELAMLLAAAMLRPSWTAGHRFTLAHYEGGPAGPATYLNIRRDQPATVTHTPPLGQVATTISCPGDVLLGVLAGKLDPATSISGDADNLLALLGWLDRAQRD